MDVPERWDTSCLKQMLADGVGDMTWLKEHLPLRADAQQLLTGAKSIAVFLFPYDPQLHEDGNLLRAIRSRQRLS